MSTWRNASITSKRQPSTLRSSSTSKSPRSNGNECSWTKTGSVPELLTHHQLEYASASPQRRLLHLRRRPLLPLLAARGIPVFPPRHPPLRQLPLLRALWPVLPAPAPGLLHHRLPRRARSRPLPPLPSSPLSPRHQRGRQPRPPPCPASRRTQLAVPAGSLLLHLPVTHLHHRPLPPRRRREPQPARASHHGLLLSFPASR